MLRSLVGSEMCIRDSKNLRLFSLLLRHLSPFLHRRGRIRPSIPRPYPPHPAYPSGLATARRCIHQSIHCTVRCRAATGTVPPTPPYPRVPALSQGNKKKPPFHLALQSSLTSATYPAPCAGPRKKTIVSMSWKRGKPSRTIIFFFLVFGLFICP